MPKLSKVHVDAIKERALRKPMKSRTRAHFMYAMGELFERYPGLNELCATLAAKTR